MTRRFTNTWTESIAVASVVFLSAALLGTTAALAQDSVEQFYKGKQLTIVVGSSSGGGYDTYARLIARHIGNRIPGNPAIVVQNMPGAGSNKAAAYMAQVAPKDGTTIAAIFPGAILQPLLGDAAVQHDPAKFGYVGSANSDTYICFARTDAPAKSFNDVFTQETILGASNEGGTTRDLPAMLNNLLGAKFRIVTGYAGSKEITLAVERNEVQGACGIGWTGLPTLYPHWFERNIVKVMAQISMKGHAELNRAGVPLAATFAKTPEDRQVMELVMSQGVFGRPYVVPPGVPAERVAALRKAFTAALQDKALAAEVARMKLDVEPMAGDELESLVARLYALPPAVVQRAKQSLVYKPAR
jgi:tripartite-type tricarboxylate transporter receptor subunit TctC